MSQVNVSISDIDEISRRDIDLKLSRLEAYVAKVNHRIAAIKNLTSLSTEAKKIKAFMDDTQSSSNIKEDR